MPKILWVALPLLIAAAVLAVQLLRGRAPSRMAINVASSVLLLGYVAATAGLGIFWVANQELPVFDWHYLFGYGTVLLVALHLVFNLPVVWRFFARRAGPASEAVPAGSGRSRVEARRGVLGALGVLAAAGAAFVLGLRHGRSELKVETSDGGGGREGAAPAGTVPSGADATALALVERFHAFSSHSRASVLLRAPGGWGNAPPPFKRHAGAPLMRLPSPGAARSAAFDLAAIADVLWHTAGVTETRGGLFLRASPSSGALFSTELYLVARVLPGLAAGLAHYEPEAHALEHLGAGPVDALLREAIDDAGLRDAPAVVVATAIFQRSGHKYRDRTYRYVLADLGHALENLRVVAGALGLQARFVVAFDEARIAGALGVNEAVEGVLAVVGLGPSTGPASPGREATIALALAPSAGASRSGWRPVPVTPSQTDAPGVTAAVHAATSLRSVSAASRPPAGMPSPAPASGELVALPTAAHVAPDWLPAIARRRSVRRYADTPLSLTVLAAVLSRMTTLPGPIYSRAVRIDLLALAVAGLAPGAYRYLPDRHALARGPARPDLRAVARAAALDQDVIGDAAAVFVLSIDRASFAADPLGPARGYRHAFLEAGMVGERVYLEAAARGLGACAVGAFYDAEAASLVGGDPTREWVVHFAALGVTA